MYFVLIEGTLLYKDIIQASLFRRGHFCISASTLEDATSYIAGFPSDYIILDTCIGSYLLVDELIKLCNVYGKKVVLVSELNDEYKMLKSNSSVKGVLIRNKVLSYHYIDSFISKLEENKGDIYGYSIE